MGSASTLAQTVYRNATSRRARYRLGILFAALYDTENRDANLAEALYRACSAKPDEMPLADLAEFDAALFGKKSGPAFDILEVIHAEDLAFAKITTTNPSELSKFQQEKLDAFADVLGAVEALLDYIRIEYPQEFYGKRDRLTKNNPGPKVAKNDYKSILLIDLFQEARVAIILGWPIADLTKHHIKRVNSVWKAYCQLRDEREISAIMTRDEIVAQVYKRTCENAPSVFKDQKKESTRLAFVGSALDDFYGRLEQPWHGSSETVDGTEEEFEQMGDLITQELLDRMNTLALALDDNPNKSRPLRAFLAQLKGHANKYTQAERDDGEAMFWDLFRNTPPARSTH